MRTAKSKKGVDLMKSKLSIAIKIFIFLFIALLIAVGVLVYQVKKELPNSEVI